MVALVTLSDVNFRLRLDLEEDGEGEFTDDRVSGFERLIEDASGIVLDYLKKGEDEWTLDLGEVGEGEGEGESSPVPAAVTAAIILVVRNLWDEVEEPLSDAVKNLVHRYRDPALK